MNIILLAPPAAGKGTQSELLEKHYNLNHISTGDLLRNTSKEDTDLGKELREVMESGKLVSDDLVLEVLNNYLDNPRFSASSMIVSTSFRSTAPCSSDMSKILRYAA